MKYVISLRFHGNITVAPFAGAWIEIVKFKNDFTADSVAPFAGAWIEIADHPDQRRSVKPSLPLRERGLKYTNNPFHPHSQDVAPFAGAWIEISMQ